MHTQGTLGLFIVVWVVSRIDTTRQGLFCLSWLEFCFLCSPSFFVDTCQGSPFTPLTLTTTPIAATRAPRVDPANKTGLACHTDLIAHEVMPPIGGTAGFTVFLKRTALTEEKRCPFLGPRTACF